jgi:hypothetical protein
VNGNVVILLKPTVQEVTLQSKEYTIHYIKPPPIAASSTPYQADWSMLESDSEPSLNSSLVVFQPRPRGDQPVPLSCTILMFALLMIYK